MFLLVLVPLSERIEIFFRFQLLKLSSADTNSQQYSVVLYQSLLQLVLVVTKLAVIIILRLGTPLLLRGLILLLLRPLHFVKLPLVA